MQAGADDIKKHKWFASDFSWTDCLDKKITPPIKPEVKNESDTGNFECAALAARMWHSALYPACGICVPIPNANLNSRQSARCMACMLTACEWAARQLVRLRAGNIRTLLRAQHRRLNHVISNFLTIFSAVLRRLGSQGVGAYHSRRTSNELGSGQCDGVQWHSGRRHSNGYHMVCMVACLTDHHTGRKVIGCAMEIG